MFTYSRKRANSKLTNKDENYLKQDKVYIVMNMVSYNVIEKGRKSNQKSYIKLLNILNYFFLCFRKGKKYPNNFIKLFWLLFLFFNDVMFMTI